MYVLLESQNVTLFGNTVFIYVIELRWGLYWIRLDRKSNDWYPDKKEIWKHRPMVKKAMWPETGVILPQTKGS